MKKLNILCSTFILMLLFISCSNDDNLSNFDQSQLEPYILSRLDSIPCYSPYYIKLIFQDSVINYALPDRDYSAGLITGTHFNTVSTGFFLRDINTNQRANISFYKEEVDSTFSFEVANYRFAESMNGVSISGANIGYSVPTGTPSTHYFYNGSNASADSYFKVTWIDEYRICGRFKTVLKECCIIQPELPVEGEFSIPRVSF